MKHNSLLLVALGILTPTLGIHASPVLIDGIYYELSGGRASVTNNGDPFSSYPFPFVEIPPIVDYEGNSYIVDEIGSGAFCFSDVMEVTLPNTIRIIADEAFRQCYRLGNLRMSENVTEIGSSAFEWCENLHFDSLPPYVYSIGEKAFSFCSLPTVLEIPRSLDHIGGAAFRGTGVKEFSVDSSNGSYTAIDGILSSKDRKILIMMPPALDKEEYIVNSCFSQIGESAFAGSRLKKIVVPESVTSIGSYAFQDCDALTEISLPSSINEFPQYMLSSCGSLKSLTIPEGVTTLRPYSLSWCDSLEEVRFPSTLKSIEWTAFYRTDGLVNLVLPEGLEYLGSSSFAQCNNLETAYIPASVKDIPYPPFNGTPNLRKVTVAPTNKNFVSLWGWLYSKDLSKLYQVTSTSTFATVIEGTTDVMEMAAWGCKRLETIVLPSTLQTVRDLAFAFCDSVKTVRIAATVPPKLSSDRCFRGVAERDNCTLYVPVGCKEIYMNSGWNVFVNIEEYNPENSVFLPARVYLVGDFNNWTCPLFDPDSSYSLHRSSDPLLYTGFFDFPAGNLSFKVFERPTDWNDALGYWGLDGDISRIQNGFSANLGAGPDFRNISISDWPGGKAEIVLNIRQQKLTVNIKPEEPVSKFIETQEIQSGKKYVIAYGDRVATPLQGNASYGYLPMTSADSISSGVCYTTESNAFTITSKGDCYTLMGSDGYYYYMTGSYNNFNRGREFEGNNGLWKITFNADGDAEIVNQYNDKIMVYSIGYHNYAAYSSIYNGNNRLPKLYVLDSETSVESIESSDTTDSEEEYFTLQGVQVKNPSGGIFIRRKGNSVTKVLIR